MGHDAILPHAEIDASIVVSSLMPQKAIVRANPSPACTPQPSSLVQFFRESPLVGVKLDLNRDKDTGRDIKL
jgi:hypothetical protein